VISIIKILNINIFNFAQFGYFYISISLIFSLFFFAYLKKIIYKIAALIFSIIFLYYIFTSSVRAAWAGLFFSFIFIIFGFIRYKFLRKYLKKIIIVLIILVLIAGSLFTLALFKYPEKINVIKEDIDGLISFKDLNTTSANNIKWRLIVWEGIFKDSLKKPFFGYGFGMLYNNETLKNMPGWYESGNEVGFIDPHNSYLSILYRCGFFGIAAYLLLIIRFFIICLKSIKDTNSEKENITIFCLLTSVIFILFISFFMVVLEGPYLGIFLWINMGLTISLIYSIKNKKKIEDKLSCG
jgi:O-antigen ligase